MLRITHRLLVGLIIITVLGVAPVSGQALSGPDKLQGVGPLSITITDPTGDVTFDETSEYATLVWNDPWDMSQALDVRQLDSAKGVYPNHFQDYTPCASGLWCGQVRSDVGNPDLFLLHPGYASALHVGRDGNLRPIDANTYKQLTFRMYLDQVPGGSVGFQVLWTTGTVANFCDAQCGQSVFFQMYPGWNIYTIDLSLSRLSGLNWAGNITGLRLDPGLANMNNRLVFLDWARLSPVSASNNQIQWTQSGESGNVTIQFQSSDSSISPLRAYTVAVSSSTPEAVPVTAGTYTFKGSLPPDDWRVVLQASGAPATSPGRWRIQGVPTLSFVKPGYTTGEDYAATLKNNPWDMNDAADVYSYANITPLTFANGLLTATSIDTNPNNTCAPGNCNPYWEDPNLNLVNYAYYTTHDPDIDTSKYRYATFRLQVNGAPDISYGWIARMLWSHYVDTVECGITNDIPLHAGWNDVSLDLWDNSILDNPAGGCGVGWKDALIRHRLRLDPFEIPVATTFSVDFVKLTAMDAGRQNTAFPIKYLLGKMGVTVVFYYDTDQDKANGRTLAAQFTAPVAPPPGPHPIYLPLIMRDFSSNPDPAGTQVFYWDLTGVPAGLFYISADVNDGSTTTTWYSDTQVNVTP